MVGYNLMSPLPQAVRGSLSAASSPLLSIGKYNSINQIPPWKEYPPVATRSPRRKLTNRVVVGTRSCVKGAAGDAIDPTITNDS